MILKVTGDISRYYVQTLCMIFFPGAFFPDGEEESADTPVAAVELTESESGYEARASLKADGKHCFGDASVSRDGTDTEERLRKRAVGQALYRAGEQLFSHSPAWGILTGVRPAKLASELMDRARRGGLVSPSASAEECDRFVQDILTRDYLARPEKAALLTTVAHNGERMLSEIPEDSCSVYISIPFCPTRCAYCSFVSYSTKKLLSLIPEYLDALCADIARIGETIKRVGQKPMTVYIGGGTPTVLDEGQLSRLLGCICEHIDMTAVREFTLEGGRPDTVTAEKLAAAKRFGVNRVSINAQTTNDDILRAIGRDHTAQDFLRAFDMAEKSGIGCINTDLIAGLPGEGYDSFVRSMDTVAGIRPQNLTVHTFCVKKSADLRAEPGAYSLTGGDTGRQVEYSQRKAAEAGYIPYYMYRQKNSAGNYENVGFSLPGFEGFYNMLIMDEIHSIFAAGAGAVTKLVSRSRTDMQRLFMPKYPYEYLARTAEDIASHDENVIKFYEEKY